jgi:hypothetical protein
MFTDTISLFPLSSSYCFVALESCCCCTLICCGGGATADNSCCRRRFLIDRCLLLFFYPTGVGAPPLPPFFSLNSPSTSVSGHFYRGIAISAKFEPHFSLMRHSC